MVLLKESYFEETLFQENPMPAKRYKVTLTVEERTTLLALVSKGKASAKKLTHARILLQVDQSENGPSWDDEHVCTALCVSRPTVERLRKRFVEEGIESALVRKQHSCSRTKKIDGEEEAHLIALACSTPPSGRIRWTMRLLADKMVELNYLDSISHEAVRKTLKKTN